MRFKSDVCGFEISISRGDGTVRFHPDAHNFAPTHLLEGVRMVSGSRFVYGCNTKDPSAWLTTVLHNLHSRLTLFRVGDLVVSDDVLLVCTGDRTVFMVRELEQGFAGLYKFERCPVVVGDRIA